MKFLLDTHVWIWALGNPRKLGMKLRRQVASGKNDLYLSPVSVWEAEHLFRRKGLRTELPFHQWLEQAFRELPVTEAPFTFAVAAEAALLVLPQPDAGDLFIAATAIVHGLTLATADEQLLACRAVKTIPND